MSIFMAVVGCDSCCKSVRYPEQQGFWGSEAPELLCSQGATQGRCSSRDLCSGLAQAGAGGQGGTRAASSLAQRVLVTMHTSSQSGRSSGLVMGIPECTLEETREGTMIFSSSASNFISRQTSDVFKEVVSLLPSLQNHLPCYFFLLGLCMCGTVLCNGINSPPHN